MSATKALRERYPRAESWCVACEREKDAQSLKRYINWYASMCFRHGSEKMAQKKNECNSKWNVCELPVWLKIKVSNCGRRVEGQKQLKDFDSLAECDEPELTPFVIELFQILEKEHVEKHLFLVTLFQDGHSNEYGCNISWEDLLKAVISGL